MMLAKEGSAPSPSGECMQQRIRQQLTYSEFSTTTEELSESVYI